MTARGRTTPDSFIGIGLEHDPSAKPKSLHLMFSAGLPGTILRMRQVARERTSVKKRDLVNVCGCELSGEWRNECVSGQISVGHSFSQTVCGIFF